MCFVEAKTIRPPPAFLSHQSVTNSRTRSHKNVRKLSFKTTNTTVHDRGEVGLPCLCKSLWPLRTVSYRVCALTVCDCQACARSRVTTSHFLTLMLSETNAVAPRSTTLQGASTQQSGCVRVLYLPRSIRSAPRVRNSTPLLLQNSQHRDCVMREICQFLWRVLETTSPMRV